MSTLFVDTPPLIAVVVIFCLSLGGAYVLFRTLKATAVLKTVRGQAGGALAGFLMIFGALDGTYLKLLPAEGASQVWTIEGEVRFNDGPAAEKVQVMVLPPPVQDDKTQYGRFRLANLEIVNGVWPQLQVTATGYEPTYPILSANQLELHPELKLAVLKEPVELWKVEEESNDSEVAAHREGPEPSVGQASGS